MATLKGSIHPGWKTYSNDRKFQYMHIDLVAINITQYIADRINMEKTTFFREYKEMKDETNFSKHLLESVLAILSESV